MFKKFLVPSVVSLLPLMGYAFGPIHIPPRPIPNPRPPHVFCPIANATTCLAKTSAGDTCRKTNKKCALFVKQTFQGAFNSAVDSKVSLIPFSLNPRVVKTTVRVEKESPVKNISMAGMTTIPALQAIPAQVGLYQKFRFGQVAPAQGDPIMHGPVLQNPQTPISHTKGVQLGNIGTSRDHFGTSTVLPVNRVNLPPRGGFQRGPITIIHNPRRLSKLKIDSELLKRQRWANQPGFESCDEFVYEMYKPLYDLEDKMTEMQGNPRGLLDYISQHRLESGAYFLPRLVETRAVGAFKLGNYYKSGDTRKLLDPMVKSFGDKVLNNNAFTYYILNLPRLSLSSHNRQLIQRAANYHKYFTSYYQLEMLIRMQQQNYSFEYAEQLQDLQTKYRQAVNSRMGMAEQLQIQKVVKTIYCMNPMTAGACVRETRKYDKMQEATYRAYKLIDQKLNQYISQAEQAGCFDPSKSVCDWSPTFARTTVEWAMGPFQHSRQEMYKICTKSLRPAYDAQGKLYVVPASEEFEHILNNLAGNDILFRDTKRWRNHPSYFVQYIREAKRYLAEIEQEQKEVKKYANIDHPTQQGKKQVGDLAGDHGFFGIEKFGGIGAGYAYGAGWSLNDYEHDISQANIKMFSKFSVHTQLFGFRKDVVSYEGFIESLKHGTKSHLYQYLHIAGVNWIAPINATEGSGHHFLLNERTSENLFSKSTYLSVFGVPLKLTVAADANVGIEADIKNTIVRTARTAHKTGKVTFASNGHFAPYASITGMASASVDAFVADIGVRGYLDLIKLSVPTTGHFNIKARDRDGLSALAMNTSVKLRLSTLDGRITAFMDTWLGDVEKTVLRWNGKSVSFPLYQSSITNPIALKSARDSLGIAL